MALAMVMLAQLIMICLSMHANGNFVSCRTIAPSWICGSLGYVDPALALPPVTPPYIVTPPRVDTFAREPGAQHFEQKSIARTSRSALSCICSCPPRRALCYYFTPSA